MSFKDLHSSKGFVTSNDQNLALQSTTGKNIHELIAEAVSHERNRMLTLNESREYIKLLTTLFGKFAIGAPQRIESTNPTDYMTRDELEDRRNNLLTRLTLEAASREHKDLRNIEKLVDADAATNADCNNTH